jgi:ubiquinone/menaquinone biosynthesis C-methylase UbiE
MQTPRIDYDQVADQYAQHRGVVPGVLHALASRLGPTSRVLEVGCGTGNYISAIAAAVGCSCWGTDPSEQMLRQAAEPSRRVRFQAGRAEQLEFPDGSLDCVFSVDVIHHVQDRAAFFREAWRVLQAGGEVWTVTDSEEIIRHRQPLATYFPETIAVDLARYPSIAELKRCMAQAGFRQITEVEVQFAKQCADISAYREKAFSCLHLIPEEAHRRGIERMEQDLKLGPIRGIARYALVSASKRMLEILPPG